MIELSTATREYYEEALLGQLDEEVKQRVQAKAFEALERDEEPESAPIPEELRILWAQENYGVMPWAGGYMDQPHCLTAALNICSNVRNDVENVQKRLLASRENNDADREI